MTFKISFNIYNSFTKSIFVPLLKISNDIITYDVMILDLN